MGGAIGQATAVTVCRQLEGLVAENCYGKKSFSYLEAEQCEKFHMTNDYKLNLINSFWKDHVPKHVLSY